MNPNQTQPIDQNVKDLVTAMGRVESPGNGPEVYKARGASGEYGRYQFMPKTWNDWSKEYGITTPLEQASIEEQNKVAYNKVKEWKDAGLNPAQIASKWNSGDENAYLRDHAGTNDQGVAYNTPEHVRKVSDMYRQIRGQNVGGNFPVQTGEVKPFVPNEQTGVQELTEQIGAGGNLASDLGGVFSNTAAETSDAFQRGISGESDPVSSFLIQPAGSLAGTVGDTADALIKNIPGVGPVYEGITDAIGGGVQGVLQSEPGQAAVEQFEKLGPDTQRNIGAGLDILSIIPFLRAFRSGKRGIQDMGTAWSEERVIKEATDELESGLRKETSRTLDNARNRGLEPTKAILDNPQLIPDIVEKNGKFVYETKQQARMLQQEIAADEKALQNLLNSTLKQNVGVNVNQIKDDVLKAVLPKGKIDINEDAIRKNITKLFDNVLRSSGRNYISLSELNDIKRQVRGNINFGAKDPYRALGKQVEAAVGSALMDKVEKIAKEAGVEGVKDINQAMGTKLTALDILEDLGGKAIKSGSTGREGLIKSVAKTIPGVEGIVDYASQGVPRTATKRLADRRPIARSLGESAKQGLVGLGLSGQITGE